MVRLEGRCCARKGRPQEEIEARGHKVIFFPKLHCELNPTEGYWCKAKWYTREHCDSCDTLEGLRRTVPQALASVEQKTVFGFFQPDS